MTEFFHSPGMVNVRAQTAIPVLSRFTGGHYRSVVNDINASNRCRVIRPALVAGRACRRLLRRWKFSRASVFAGGRGRCGWLHISIARQGRGRFRVGFRGFGSPGGQAVDIAVVHAKSRSDQHSVVDLLVGCSLLPGSIDILGLDRMAPDANLLGDVQQRFQFF